MRTPKRRSRARAKSTKRKGRGPRLLGFETLENRELLAITPSLVGQIATFSGDDAPDTLHLRVADTGILEYSTDATHYSSDLGAGATLTLTAAANVQVGLAGGHSSLFIDSSLGIQLTSTGATLNYHGKLANGDDLVLQDAPGSATAHTWNLTTAGAGSIGKVTFDGVTNLVGGSGDDTYRFGAGALGSFFLDETAGGVDTVDLSASTSAVTIDLSKNDEQTINPDLKLTLSAVNVFENVVGSSLPDTITGNELDNTITGGAGSDSLVGDFGDDTYVLDINDWGTDTIAEGGNGEGTDTIQFTAVTANVTVTKLANGPFTLASSAANSIAFDNLEALTGGAGANLLDFTLSTEAVVVNLAGGVSTDFSSLLGFSNVVGSAFGDTLIGNERANTLTGGPGNDVISGGVGADVIDGGAGSDRLAETRDVNFTLTNISLTASGTGITGSEVDTLAGIEFVSLTGGASANVINASGFTGLTLTAATPLANLNRGAGIDLSANDLTVHLTDGTSVSVNLTGATTIGDVLAAIQAASPRLTAKLEGAGTGIEIVDSTNSGATNIRASSVSSLASDLGLDVDGVAIRLTGSALGGGVAFDGGSTVLLSLLNNGAGVRRTNLEQMDLSNATLPSTLNQSGGVHVVTGADFRITLTDGQTIDVDLTAGITTIQGVIDAMVNAANAVESGRLTVVVNPDTNNSLLLRDSKAAGGDLKVTALNSSTAAANFGILREGSGTSLAGLSISDLAADLRVTLSDGTRIDINLTGATTFDDVLQKLNAGDPRFTARINTTGTGLILGDTSGGAGTFTAVSLNGSFAAADLGIIATGAAGVIIGTNIVGPGSLRLDGRLDHDTLIGSGGGDLFFVSGGDTITGGLGLDTISAERDADMTLANRAMERNSAAMEQDIGQVAPDYAAPTLLGLVLRTLPTLA